MSSSARLPSLLKRLKSPDFQKASANFTLPTGTFLKRGLGGGASTARPVACTVVVRGVGHGALSWFNASFIFRIKICVQQKRMADRDAAWDGADLL
jgi:hypothetical protein